MNDLFHTFAAYLSKALGSIWGFVIALVLMLTLGFFMGFAEKWTVEAIVVLLTFFILFFIQHSQIVNDKATHLKLDEIIRALEGARNEVAEVEETDEKLMDDLKQSHPDAHNEKDQ